jgi:hypothetical protein
MPTQIAAKMTSEGLLIPRDALQGWDEVDVIKEEDERITVRPQTSTDQQKRALAIQALRDDSLLADLDWDPAQPPATPEERAELAKKLSTGRPLSEIIIEERRAGW